MRTFPTNFPMLVKSAWLTSKTLGVCLIFMGAYYLELPYWLGELLNIRLGTELPLPKSVSLIAATVLASGIGIVWRHAWGYFLLYTTTIVATIYEWIFAITAVPLKI